MACCSTTKDRAVVTRYAASETPLVFKIKVDRPMELGSDISWLSLFPEEKEILYPPLTHLQPVRSQGIVKSKGRLLTVKPSYPS